VSFVVRRVNEPKAKADMNFDWYSRLLAAIRGWILDCLKACTERAKLDKDDFWLHKFRATFATRCLWTGVDLRTVQQWLGHSDIESTMRYLKPSRSSHVREKVNEIFG